MSSGEKKAGGKASRKMLHVGFACKGILRHVGMRVLLIGASHLYL